MADIITIIIMEVTREVIRAEGILEAAIVEEEAEEIAEAEDIPEAVIREVVDFPGAEIREAAVGVDFKRRVERIV